MKKDTGGNHRIRYQKENLMLLGSSQAKGLILVEGCYNTVQLLVALSYINILNKCLTFDKLIVEDNEESCP